VIPATEIYVGARHVREVYDRPVMIECDWGKLVSCELIFSAPGDALYVDNRIALDDEIESERLDPWQWPPRSKRRR